MLHTWFILIAINLVHMKHKHLLRISEIVFNATHELYSHEYIKYGSNSPICVALKAKCYLFPYIEVFIGGVYWFISPVAYSQVVVDPYIWWIILYVFS